uniref:Cytochrome b561 domain-containing protein n=1 Tax=Solanum lycopersicum TaxID=4081 RepID=A0A3Q7ELH0_SOLLC
MLSLVAIVLPTECNNKKTQKTEKEEDKVPSNIEHHVAAYNAIIYSQSKDNVITIVLSTIHTSGWVGMGFSREGMMINSSCMDGWVTPAGHGKIKQYYVEGITPSKIIPDKGELPLTTVPPLIYLQGASATYPTPLKTQPMTQSLWYYFHVSAQFILGLAGVVLGIHVNNKLQPDIPGHQGIGILILVLGILQVLVFFVRPDKDSKYRNCWNDYHSWMGRTALFFGALNIVLGMHYAGAGQGWKLSYGFFLASTMLACIILETLLRQ